MADYHVWTNECFKDSALSHYQNAREGEFV